MPIMNICLRPSRSARRPPKNSRPPVASAEAVQTHWTSSVEKLRSSTMDRVAVKTTVDPSTTVRNAPHSTAKPNPSARIWSAGDFLAKSLAGLGPVGDMNISLGQPSALRGPKPLAATRVDNHASDPPRIRRRQEGHHIGDVAWLPESSE